MTPEQVAEVKRLQAERDNYRDHLGAALSVPTLGDARAEIIGLRSELATLKRGAAEARRADDERHATATAERDALEAEVKRLRVVLARREGSA